jgi:hypothetical protein
VAIFESRDSYSTYSGFTSEKMNDLDPAQKEISILLNLAEELSELKQQSGNKITTTWRGQVTERRTRKIIRGAMREKKRKHDTPTINLCH